MKQLCTIFSLFFSLATFAQMPDSVSLGAGANDMVFYNAGTRIKTTTANHDWHIAFSTRPAAFPNNTNQSAAVRINEAFGLKLYHSTQKLSTWSTFDTTGWQGWQQMHNPDTTWTIGAFNINKNFADAYNYGWGGYHFSAHNVVGDSTIYMIVMPDGSFRKFAILDLAYDTAFHVQFDKLDNSDFKLQEIRKIPYRTKSFVYYNLDTKVIMDKEPAISAWDLIFLRYTHLSPPSANQSQDIGILTNDANTVYSASGATAQQPCYTGPGSIYINVIGKTWHDFNPDSVIHGISYFYYRNAAQLNNKITLTATGGVTSGMIYFETNECGLLGINDVTDNSALNIYPVPAADLINVKINAEKHSEAILILTDMRGRVISSSHPQLNAGENHLLISTENAMDGIYILTICYEDKTISRRVSVVK